MKTQIEVKQNVKQNERQITMKQNVSSCCGPTCCSNSNDKNDNKKKEK